MNPTPEAVDDHSCSGMIGLGLVAVVVAAGFGSAAAVGHVAPASSAVTSVVLEEPVAGRAVFKPVVGDGGDEVGSVY